MLLVKVVGMVIIVNKNVPIIALKRCVTAQMAIVKLVKQVGLEIDAISVVMETVMVKAAIK